jgi:hypothetical protein
MKNEIEQLAIGYCQICEAILENKRAIKRLPCLYEAPYEPDTGYYIRPCTDEMPDDGPCDNCKQVVALNKIGEELSKRRRSLLQKMRRAVKRKAQQ